MLCWNWSTLDDQDLERLFSSRFYPSLVQGGKINSADFHRTAYLLVTASDDYSVWVYDIKVRPLASHKTLCNLVEPTSFPWRNLPLMTLYKTQVAENYISHAWEKVSLTVLLNFSITLHKILYNTLGRWKRSFCNGCFIVVAIYASLKSSTFSVAEIWV